MKKKINTQAIVNELQGSVFFPKRQQEPLKQEDTSSPTLQPPPLTRDTTTPRYHDTKHDTMISSNHDTMASVEETDILEGVRKAVRQFGKEPATQRLTLEEKQALADIEYSYKRQGIRTSGNEIIRIAANYIVREYQQNGANSILAQVLKKLNS